MPRDKTCRGLELAALLALGTVACWSCDDGGTGPAGGDPGLWFMAPVLAMFPGMEDTLIAMAGWERLGAGVGTWRSSDPGVLRVEPGGGVRAVGIGVAEVSVELEGVEEAVEIEVVEPPGGRIAFVGVREEVTEAHGGSLWIMSADGSGKRLLRGLTLSNPDFSPDGCSIVVQEPDWLRRVDVETGVGPVIFDAGKPGPPAWTPDGERIAFSGLAATGFEVFSVRAEGGDLRQHTTLGEPQAIPLDFFPDGRAVIEHTIVEDDVQYADLYRLDLETGDIEPITSRASADERFPSVAPDGRYIAFAGHVSAEEGGWMAQLFGPDSVIRLLTQPSRVMVMREVPDGTRAVSSDPAFSPDGEWVAVSWNRDRRVVEVRDIGDGEQFLAVNTTGEIYVMRRDGGSPVRLTHFFAAGNPAWGPECQPQ